MNAKFPSNTKNITPIMENGIPNNNEKLPSLFQGVATIFTKSPPYFEKKLYSATSTMTVIILLTLLNTVVSTLDDYIIIADDLFILQ